jgi:glycine cleavage system regulatory protein
MIFKEFAQLLTQQGVPIPDMNSQLVTPDTEAGQLWKLIYVKILC